MCSDSGYEHVWGKQRMQNYTIGWLLLSFIGELQRAKEKVRTVGKQLKTLLC
jgi:hypothetical protein